jgi:hypothetical protein
MKMQKYLWGQKAKSLLLLSGLILSAGCSSIQFVPPYDDQLDKDVTALQTATETFLVKIEREGSSSPDDYKKNYTDFYDKEKVAISGLEVRAGAVAVNDQTEGQIKILNDLIGKMETRHKDSGLSVIDATQYEQDLNRVFRAILTLEIAKKSVGTTTNSSH